MKKIRLVFIALIVAFAFVYAEPTKQVEAAIFSKVASKGAQKIVKEIIKESAFDYAVNIFLDEAFAMALEERKKYQAQQDYEIFCGKKMPDLITCEKPMQVKSNLTALDKANIGQQAEIELDKLITNGKGFTRWQKFLDWFIPIWVSAFALTAITYALDPEVRSLFNEAGYNTLLALGLIKPVTGTPEPFAPVTTLPQTAPIEPNPDILTFTESGTAYGSLKTFTLPTEAQNKHNYVVSRFTIATTATKYHTDFNYSINGTNVLTSTQSGLTLGGYLLNPVSIVVATNGQETGYWETAVSNLASYNNYSGRMTQSLSTIFKKTNSVMHRMPYEVNGFWYTDVLWNTTDGNAIHFQIKTNTAYENASTITTDVGRTYSSATTTHTLFMNQNPLDVILTPTYEDVAPTMENKKTIYENVDGKVTLVPPSALPYTQTSTGVALEPVKNETTGDIEFKTPTGENVPEDDITVGEPNIQDNPEGQPNTYTPPATSTNPNPEPVPIKPPPPGTPTTGTPPPPPPEDGGGGKPNIPISLLLGLFKLLNAIIFYIIRMAAFVVTIQFIEPTIIPNPYFQWFTTAEILGIKPYPLVKNVALFFLSFSIYKSIRRVFP